MILSYPHDDLLQKGLRDEEHVGTTGSRLRSCPRRSPTGTPVDSIRSRRTRSGNPIRQSRLNLFDGHLYGSQRSVSSQMGRRHERSRDPKLHVQRGRLQQSSDGIRNGTNHGRGPTLLPQVAVVDARVRSRNINTGPGSSEKERRGVKATEVGGLSPPPDTIPPTTVCFLFSIPFRKECHGHKKQSRRLRLLQERGTG